MKIGDTLICKKAIVYEDEGFEYFSPGKTYTICQILSNKLKLLDENKVARSFYLIAFMQTYMQKYLWDYFYTPQEVRKLKIKKLQ